MNLLSRRLETGSGPSLSSGQLALDATLRHFCEEATNPVTIASMTLGGLAFQGTRTGLLGLGISQNSLIRNGLTYAGALASEVTVFRASNRLLQEGTSEGTFSREWFSTALDIGLLKFTGLTSARQNIFLRHASQDLAMVTGHEIGAHLGWIPAQSGTFIEKLFQAEALNWSMIAGSALGHRLTGGRLQILERSLSLRAETLSRNFNRFEPRWNDTLLSLASQTDPSLVPAPIRIFLKIRPGEMPKDWAQRLIEFTFEKPEENALHVITQLYERIQNPESREYVLETLRHMEELSCRIPEGENLLVRRYSVEGLPKPILLVSLPTTFLPEAWSHTFVHGMALDHQTQAQTRNLAIEVGSGTGFVSIAMAKLGMAQRIIATDKNPHGRFIGRLNAAINGVEDRIEFQTGDLLAEIPEGSQADLIVGCLPQMPSKKPNGEISLRDLADYAEERGVFEDRLALGINATVINQAQTRLSPDGKLRLMMAQRPGLEVVHDLFAVRGFAPRLIHSTLIQQDPTTDFEAMVRIEAETGFRFEFRNPGGQVMSATEAISRPRDQIFHHLHLVEASPYPALLRRSLEEMGTNPPRWAYTEDPGTEHPRLRSQIKHYLEGRWGVEINPESIFIAPSQATLLEGLLRLRVSPLHKIGIVGELDTDSQKVIDRHPEIHSEKMASDLEGLARRVEANPPQALLLKLPRQILRDSRDLEDLLRVAGQKNILLIFLEEQGALFNSSDGKVLLKTLSRFPQASGHVVIHSLDRMFGTPAFPLAAALIPDRALREALAHYGDVSYSRASTAVQEAYARFFEQEKMQNPKPIDAEGLGATGAPKAIAVEGEAPWALPMEGATRAPIIDMSFGESEWAPDLPWGDILRLASQTPHKELYQRAHLATLRYLATSRQSFFTDHEIALGGGVQPLLVSTIRGIQKLHPGQEVEVLVPEPSYGIFFPMVEAAGARLQRIPTSSKERFLVTPPALAAIPQRPGTVRLLLLNTPTNPAGQYYSARLLSGLLNRMSTEGGYLLIDEVFGLLALSDIDRLTSLSAFQHIPGKSLVTLGGISKEFALGGIRFGFAASENISLIQAIQRENPVPADPIALATASEAFPAWQRLVYQHTRYLIPKVFELETFLRRQGYPVQRVEGGYALFADLRKLFEIPHFIGGEQLTPDNFHHLLLQHAGIKIKSDQWAGVPGHYRFVFSIDRLPEAVQRLKRFFDSLQASP